jgi:hypothetical protein
VDKEKVLERSMPDEIYKNYTIKLRSSLQPVSGKMGTFRDGVVE